MKIGLYNLEPKIINTAMMQVSYYHKGIGDEVQIYNSLFHSYYDKVYAFSIFNFTDKSYVRKDMICGGTGFNIKSKLPKEIEDCDYDWGLYPKCDHSIIWFSRGCFRNCRFCIVMEKEGCIKSVKPKNLNPNGKFIRIQDNNFFANPKWKDAIKQLQEWDQPIMFDGVDARLLNEEKINALLSLKHHKQIKIAWDNPKDDMIPILENILKYIKAYRLMCYVFIDNNTTEKEDMYRIDSLINLKIDPFVMPFNKRDKYQKSIARWCNRPAIRKKCKYQDYDKYVKKFVV